MTNREIGLYINGEAFPGDRCRQQDLYHLLTGDVHCHVSVATVNDLNQSVYAAKTASHV